ncbi:ABC transporter permease [Fulvivirgaceae bacterium BMA12]|uniref:ABC transporter permease n=1 Tax=Agaribacillus aureus TaxID=3051825 RepID=A0ABT8L644_9BACT|nr:ABC transporter permease [Fulvivirgaceae bacterium BMA12]
MNIFRLSLRNMTSRPLSTTLSLVLLTLGVGMIALLLQVSRHIQEQMENNIREIDMVVGAKGSPLQLILSAVYHIDAPTGNISLQEAEQLQKNRLVESGIPLSYGDSYKGYRIVGTNHQYPALYEATVANGRLWQKSFEVAIGATVAKNLSLKIGDTFTGAHGLAEGGETHEDHAYQIVGILGYSNSVLDQLILTATESVWEVHHHEDHEESAHEDHDESAHEDHEESTHEDHEKSAHEDHEESAHGDHEEEMHEAHDESKEITAMLVKFRNPMAMVQLPRLVNENTNMQAAVPAYEISRLFSLMGVGVDTLSTIALVIMAVSGLSVFISLYNALKDRQYEMALMRTYGATRWQLVWLVLQEGLLLTLAGFLLGILFSRLGLWLVSGLMKASYHYEFSGWAWVPEEGWLLAIALAIGLLASLLPAIRVFRINISKTLADA